MPTTQPARSLHAKLAAVMAEAERIPKNGKAPEAMGGFQFVQVGDAADFIRKALGERGISMLPTSVEVLGQNEHPTRSGSTMTTLEVRTTWTLTDGETGETATIQSYGAGADTGDKYSGKAQTNAMKYALLMGFLLSTGDDPEQADTSDRQSTTTARRGDSEVLELVGAVERSGTIAKGEGRNSKLEARQTPIGHHIGFRLTTQHGAIPQVVADGAIGDALVLAAGDDLDNLVGLHVKVSGKLYNVKSTGRRSYYRLALERIESDEWVIPADVAPGQETLSLTDDEKAAIGGTDAGER